MRRFRIDILGASFSLETDQDEASMGSLISRLEGAVDSARAQTSSPDPLKLAIIAGLILADEAQRGAPAPEGGEGMEEAERIALKLISDLDERLGR